MNDWCVVIKKGAFWGILSPKYLAIKPVTFWPTGIFPDETVTHGNITLDKSGRLDIKIGFTWDGPSGPTVDDAQNLKASLCHDALFRLGARGLLPKGWFSKSNKLMRIHMLERRDKKLPARWWGLKNLGKTVWNRVRRGAQTARSWVYYLGLEVFGWGRFGLFGTG